MNTAAGSRPLRVCIVVPYDVADEGGVKRHAFHVAESLRGRGDEVTVIGPLSRGKAERGFRGFGGVVNITANGAANYMALLTPPWAVRRFFQTSDFDVVHIHEPLVPLLAYYALWFSSRAAHVCTFHMYAEHEDPRAQAVRRMLANRMFHRFERGIVVSQPAAEYAGRVWTRPLSVIPNGVPTRVFHPPEPDDSAGFQRRALRLLFVGHWRDSRKGLPHLLKAHRMLRADGVRVSLDVVGSGTPGTEEQEDVTFHGPVTSEAALAGHYRNCDVFVAPATGQESFGIVLLEAMACARPVVCSDIPGYRQVVDAAGGLFVAPGDVDGLARAIADLARSPEARRRMGRSNRSRAETFDWDPISGRVREQYLAAIEERRIGSLARTRLLAADA